MGSWKLMKSNSVHSHSFDFPSVWYPPIGSKVKCKVPCIVILTCLNERGSSIWLQSKILRSWCIPWFRNAFGTVMLPITNSTYFESRYYYHMLVTRLSFLHPLRILNTTPSTSALAVLLHCSCCSLPGTARVIEGGVGVEKLKKTKHMH